MNTIQAGDVLKARSICDYDTVFEAEVLERKGRFVTVKAEGQTRRVMVMSDGEGEFIYAMGRYSMAPIFRALHTGECGARTAPSTSALTLTLAGSGNRWNTTGAKLTLPWRF